MKRNKNFSWSKANPDSLDLRGMKVAIIGGTGGIGRAFSRFMASRGASVLVVGQMFRDTGHTGIEFIQADLSLMREARRIAGLLPAETLDLVIFTTGIFAAPERQETEEGIERDMAVSYLSRLVILKEIVGRLGRKRTEARGKVRVFIMGFPGTGQTGTYNDLNSTKSYKAMPVHMNTVAGNEILVLDSAKRYKDINFYGLNPGLIKTNIRSNFLGGNKSRYRLIEFTIGLLTISAKTYARRMTPLLASPDIEEQNGLMFNHKAQAILPSEGLTEDHMRSFITASEELVTGVSV